MLQQAHLKLQFFVGFGKFSGSLCNPPIEFARDMSFCSLRSRAPCSPMDA